MNNRARERGEGRIGLLLALALLGTGIFVCVKIIPVRVNAYEFAISSGRVPVRRNEKGLGDLQAVYDKRRISSYRSQRKTSTWSARRTR
jgi:hypothetical protein